MTASSNKTTYPNGHRLSDYRPPRRVTNILLVALLLLGGILRLIDITDPKNLSRVFWKPSLHLVTSSPVGKISLFRAS